MANLPTENKDFPQSFYFTRHVADTFQGSLPDVASQVTAAVKKLLSPDAKLAAEKHLGFVWANKKLGTKHLPDLADQLRFFFLFWASLSQKETLFFFKVYDT